jgi:hypothetical protein
MNFDELKSRDVKDLRVLAAQYGIKTGPRSKAESIAKLIFEFVANKPKEQVESLKHPAEINKLPEVIHTQEEVEEVIKAFASKDGFEAKYLPDNTWIFKYKGAEESGHMSCPLRVIRMKAESVSHGARKVKVVKIDDALIMSA